MSDDQANSMIDYIFLYKSRKLARVLFSLSNWHVLLKLPRERLLTIGLIRILYRRQLLANYLSV